MTSRRQQILDTAAELFAARGFHGVSVGDIGAACGISGPALYRHFPAKDAMLAEMLTTISERLLEVGRQRAETAEDPMRALVRWHLEFALEHQALIVVQDRDWTSLAPEAQEEVRRLQRAYIDLWVDRLRARRPDLGARQARARVQAVFGLLNSTPRSAHLPPQEMADLLEHMALATLEV